MTRIGIDRLQVMPEFGPAVFRPSTATFFFRHTLTEGVADSQFPFGESPWLPVAGTFGLG